MTVDLSSFFDNLKGWQTLTTGVVALVAAWWTVRAINKQAKLQQDQLDEDRRRHETRERREERVARAELPDALSNVIHYAQEYAEFWRDNDCTARPVPPTDAMNTIKRVIGVVDDQSAETLIELVHFYQVHNARSEPRHSSTRPSQRLQAAYDALRLHATAEMILPFARREVDSVENERISRQQMITALRVGYNLRLPEQDAFIRQVEEFIHSRHPCGGSEN